MDSKNKLSLWHVCDEINAFNEMIMQDDGEITKTHEELEREMYILLKTKTDGCYEYVEHLKGMIELAKNKKKEIESYIKTTNNHIERFSEYIINCLESCREEKFEGDVYQIKLRASSKAIQVIDKKEIPFDYFIEQEPVLDKKKLMGDFKNGKIGELGFKVIDGKKSINFSTRKITKKKEKNNE